jgi:hypothetical protein
MKPIKKKYLKNIEIEVDNDGFAIWIKEKDGTRHWLLDGSYLKQNGIIRMGQHYLYRFHAVVKDDNTIELIDSGKPHV